LSIPVLGSRLWFRPMWEGLQIAEAFAFDEHFRQFGEVSIRP
jgi:hypothetical protein